MKTQPRKTITVGGRTLSYLEAGSSGPLALVLVLIHGFPLHADMWQPQLDAVPSGWRIVAPDLRGFGPAATAASSPSEGARSAGEGVSAPTSLDDYADDVLMVMDSLAIAGAVIGGLSMGGYVTFALFRKAAERFAGMVLADTRPQADTDEARANRLKMRDRLAREGVAGVADDMMPKLLGESTRRKRPAIERHLRALIDMNRPAGVDAAIVAIMNRPDSTPQLGSIRCPTLVAVGSEDTLTPPADAERMQRAIAGSRLQIIPEAGHMANVENVDAFNAALFGFLKESW